MQGRGGVWWRERTPLRGSWDGRDLQLYVGHEGINTFTAMFGHKPAAMYRHPIKQMCLHLNLSNNLSEVFQFSYLAVLLMLVFIHF